jgi:hypothetical protein
MRGLTDGVMNTGQASPIAVFDQQAVKFGESRHRHAWWSHVEGREDSRVQYPASDRDDDAVADFYMDEFTSSAALAIHTTQPSAVQRMPPIEDLNFLTDMGRMNRNWQSGGRTVSVWPPHLDAASDVAIGLVCPPQRRRRTQRG